MKLATRRLGNGPRVAALVHGASASSLHWRDFANILIEQYDISVILVDLRGHGASPWVEHYVMEDFADDLVETLPMGLDFLIGQSLGGISSAEASARLAPKRYIGIDPAFRITPAKGVQLRILGPLAPHLPDNVLSMLGSPPKGAAPDTLSLVREGWKTWDPSMMADLQKTVPHRPFVVGPPPVPSTVVLADPSFAVPPKMAADLRAAGWDVRVKPGGVHELHLQDPRGLAALLDDVLVDPARVPSADSRA